MMQSTQRNPALKFKELPLKGAYIIEPDPSLDERGFFARIFCEDEFKKAGLPHRYVQASFSYNKKKNTLRGMHYQNPPHEEDKLVTCVRGAIFDVIIDVRKNSPTYLKWHGEILSGDNYKSLFIPKGFAHGFLSLEDDSLLHYNISEFYKPGSASGIRYDDPKIGIQWPKATNYIISEKDKALPVLA